MTLTFFFFFYNKTYGSEVIKKEKEQSLPMSSKNTCHKLRQWHDPNWMGTPAKGLYLKAKQSLKFWSKWWKRAQKSREGKASWGLGGMRHSGKWPGGLGINWREIQWLWEVWRQRWEILFLRELEHHLNTEGALVGLFADWAQPVLWSAGWPHVWSRPQEEGPGCMQLARC